MFSASNFVASMLIVICVFWARIVSNEHKSCHCLVSYKMSTPELQLLKALHRFSFVIPPLAPATPAIPLPRLSFFFWNDNYYLINLLKSEMSDYLSSRKMVECVFKFWVPQLNLAKVHCFLNPSKMEHCASDCCFGSLIKTLKGQRNMDWSKIHSFTIHTAQSKCRTQPHISCISTRMFVEYRILFLWVAEGSKWLHLFY